MDDEMDDPRALFGEAVSDRKQLRRAYARLIRKHPPDADPERFQAIRAAYEAALDALDNPDRAAPEERVDVEALIDALTPETFDATLATLSARARVDASAGLTALFLVHATRPDAVLDWLAEQRREGLSDDAMVHLVIGLLDIRPPLATAPMIDALRAGLDPPRAALLNGHRVRALIRAEAFDAGFEAWRAHEAALRAHQPQSWDHIADAVLFYACDRTPDDIMVAIEDAMEDVALELSDYAHEELTRGLRQARALKALVAEPSTPLGLIEALRLGRRTSDPGVYAAARQARYALLQMGNGDLDAGVLALQLAHPDAYRMLRTTEFQLTGRMQFQLEWMETGEADHRAPSDIEPVILAQVRDAMREDFTRAELAVIPTLLGVWVIAATIFQSSPMIRLSGLLLLVVSVMLFLAGWQRRENRRRRRRLRPLWAILDDLQRRYGLWRHELYATLHASTVQLTPAQWVPLCEDRNADLRCLSAAHGFRASVMPPADDDTDDTDDADDPEEDADEHST